MRRYSANNFNNYSYIDEFAPNINNAYSTDPLSYCVPDYLDSQFLHGGIGRTFGKYNMKCQEFMSARCAKEWDGVCEAASKDPETVFPNMARNMQLQVQGQGQYQGFTAGENLIRDTAFKKYKTRSANCNLKCEPFDPTVPNSPLVCFESSDACAFNDGRNSVCSGNVQNGPCISEYSIKEEQIAGLDNDPVMNKLLSNPQLAPTLLEGIYNTMKRQGRLGKLQGTKLGHFYSMNGFRL
jgi:hypothetical protein